MTETCLIYVTAGDREEAERIARTVVEERLAACANILGEITSIYRWEGTVCDGKEVAFLLKTAEERKAGLVERIRQLHSYECPCVISLPITDGHAPFIDWIRAETG